jgi:hypothetical protein
MASTKQLTSSLTETAHNVWLAGLGALAAAGDQSGKLLKTLVARGARVEKAMTPGRRAGRLSRATTAEGKPARKPRRKTAKTKM